MKVIHYISLILIVLLTNLSLFINSIKAHDKYNTWVIPNTKISCCNNKDCQITKAYWDGKQWVAWFKDKYIPIPKSKVLRTDNLKDYDGNAHLCARETNIFGGGTITDIFCFAPSEAKF